ncbi:protein-S-isoprenylcysteine methyltransferase [Vibrio genomosp. F10 str. 9ZD137]|nr:protein-S-isoprenylcysteine methyltransferase [Vibrio genomosp. F10 str. 9ZD137]
MRRYAYKGFIVNLEQKIPPVILTIIFVGIMYLTNLYLKFTLFDLPFKVEVLLIFFIIGVTFALAGVISFKKHKTTLDPMNTENVSTLVKSGVYRYTRNPMYVGMLMALLGYGFFLSNPINLFITVLFIWYMNKFQIKPEEVFLSSVFGNDYDEYKKSVKRWL